METSLERFDSKLRVFDNFEFSSVQLRPLFLENSSCNMNGTSKLSILDSFGKETFNKFNQGVKIATSADFLGISDQLLDEGSLDIKVYSDGSFANNDDQSSQLRYVILSFDAYSKTHKLDYSSKNSKRIVRSIMGSESYAFTNAFYQAFIIKDMDMMLRISIPFHM